MIVHLYLDEDGLIWHDDNGDYRQVGNLSAYDYGEERQLTREEVIQEAIAESTDAPEGRYELYSVDTMDLIEEGRFGG